MTRKYRSRSFSLAALFFLSASFVCIATASAESSNDDGNASFPEVSDSWSPDGRFLLKNVETREDPKNPHSIYLTDMQSGARKLLYSYPRKVDLLWAPASNAVAINDWEASDQSQCIVLLLAPRRERIDVREELLKSSRPDREKRLASDHHDYDHNYAHLLRWLDARTVLLAIEGYSSDRKRNFRLLYEYKLGDSFRLRDRIIH
jgi:hypothetical protein